MTKEPHSVSPQPTPQPQNDGAIAIVSMVLGIVSLTGPGLLLGIPAIITAIIALKKNIGNRGFSITGLVTGIVSTVISFLFLIFMVFLIIWGIHHPDQQHPGMHNYDNSNYFQSSRL